ncbi:hypothetical protein C4565_01945 [Candidatus Parcubacteria bacterium]|nr:MAG: hypothetical protein C4565_01945 [Candidatus Parcubacteria bacterium]
MSITVAPVFAERAVQVTKEIDVRKEVLATILTDLRSYKEIFPTLVKDVQIDSKTNQAKFIIIAQGTHEADVKSSILQDGSFVIDITSGDLKGSQIITSLEKKVGFDGTPDGATIVKATLTLETSWWISAALTLVSDSDIEKAVGDGFYELGQYAKSEHSQELIKINHDEKASTEVLQVSIEPEKNDNMQKLQVFKIETEEKPKFTIVKTERSFGRNSVFFST